MEKTFLKIGVLLMTCLSLNSCATYLISPDSLKAQFSNIDSSKLIPVIVQGPVGERYNYLANPITVIKCTDKNGNQIGLNNSPAIEMRVTDINNKKTIFYFDRIFVSNTS